MFWSLFVFELLESSPKKVPWSVSGKKKMEPFPGRCGSSARSAVKQLFRALFAKMKSEDKTKTKEWLAVWITMI